MRDYFLFLLAAFFFTLWIPLETAAQVKQTSRFELEQKNSDQEFILIPMKEEGLALVRDKDKFKEGKRE